MPVVTIPLPDIEKTVTRPSIYQVIDQVRDILSMEKDAEVLYAGKRGVIRATGSAVSEAGRENEAKFNTDDYVKIEVIETPDTDAVQEIQHHSYDNRPVFLDKLLGFSLRPIYHPTKIEITFSYQSTSETTVNEWMAAQITKASRGRDTHLHHVSYRYPLSMEFLIAMTDIHRLREAVDGYGEDLMTYFNKHRSNRLTFITNLAGEQAVPVVHEHQGEIVGSFDFTVAPEKPVFNKDKGTWTAEFTYRYTFWKPEQCMLEYPIAVHNQLMPEIYLKDLEEVVDYQTNHAHYSYGGHALANFSLDKARGDRYPTPYLNIPSYDDFKPEVKRHTATIFMARCFLDDTQSDLLDFNDLGDLEIDSDILAFLRSEAPYLTKQFFSVFLVEHYVNGMLQPYEDLEVTPELMVRSKKKLSYRDTHHVRFAAIPEITHPLYEALKRVSRSPKAFLKIVASFNELLAADPDFGSLDKYDRIEEWMFTSIYRILFMTHQGNFHSTGTNLDSYINEMVFSPKNALGLLEKFPVEYIKDWMNTKRRKQLIQMNTALIAKARKDM